MLWVILSVVAVYVLGVAAWLRFFGVIAAYDRRELSMLRVVRRRYGSHDSYGC